MEHIILTDNTRYYLDLEIKDKKILNRNGIEYIGEKYLNIIKKLPYNPLTTENIDGVEFLEKDDDRECDTLILKIETINGQTYLHTGNMIGEFYCKITPKQICKITIGLRFDKDGSHSVLEYLLNYSNAIYPDKIEFNAKETSKKRNKIVELLLTKMFTNSLAKANIMGFPTLYQEIYETDYNVRGRIDIQKLISHELLFKGKTSYVKNERVLVESIGNVLLVTILKLQALNNNNNPFLSKVRSELKQQGVKAIVTHQVINDAMQHKALNNPIFSEYKTTLYLASLILKGFQTPKADTMKGVFYGYLVDISKIWENYLVKLFEFHFDKEWKVKPEVELKLFENRPNFTNMKNEMRPDIVLYNKKDSKKVMVFDAKFKSSSWFNREDFYKTVAYVSYYQNNGCAVVLSGQIYPDKNLDKINENVGFLSGDIDFRFFGINLEDGLKKDEKAFIKRIKIISGEN